MLAAEILIIGIGIRGAPFGDLRTRRTQPQLEGINHDGGDFVLYLEDIADVALVHLLCPDLVATIGANQLYADTDGVTGFAHAALGRRRQHLGRDRRC